MGSHNFWVVNKTRLDSGAHIIVYRHCKFFPFFTIASEMLDKFELVMIWFVLCYFLYGQNRTAIFLVSMVIIYMAYYREKVLTTGNAEAARPINDALERYIECEKERAVLTVKILRNFMENMLT